MYLPPVFELTDGAQVAALLSAARLGCLITHGPSGLFASHIPLIYDRDRDVLSGHLAKANPHPARAGEGEALVIYSGVEAYISPTWYPSKIEHGKVVPTWNYEVAHVYGSLTWIEDADWLRANVEALTMRFEADPPQPWSVSDAPAEHIGRLLGGIIGVEIQINRVQVKRKLSQNRTRDDQEGVIAGLAGSTREGDRAVAAAMAETMSASSPKPSGGS